MAEIEKNIEQDAKIKFEKLLEVANDIETHGQSGGDQFLRQTVLTAVVKSDNELLYKNLEEALFDENYSEMFKTIISGLFLQKGKGEVLAKYTEYLLNEELILDDSFEKKEALLLTADAMVNFIKSNEETVDEDVLNTLLKLFTASCSSQSTAVIADMLLQRFMNLFPNKSKFIDEKLSKLIHDKDYDFNTRLISVDILGRSKTFEFFDSLQYIIVNLPDYTNTNTEQLYFLDVATKLLKTVAKRGLDINYGLSLMWLDINDIDEISSRSKEEASMQGITDTVHIDVISKRVKDRIKEVNSLHHSNN